MQPNLSFYYVFRGLILVVFCVTILQCLYVYYPQTLLVNQYTAKLAVSDLNQLLTNDFPENVKMLDQDDPLLQKYIKLRHLTPPSKLPYNFTRGTYLNGHSQLISQLFRDKKNGTFIECGAYDGVAASNSLFFEIVLGWSGLLVECNPYTIPVLKMKRRKAWIADVCLSPEKNPKTLEFSNPTKWGPSARIGDPIDLKPWGLDTPWTKFEVEAMPLYAILSAINLTVIDYFTLDIEGAEYAILKTIPFDKITIKVIDMEITFYSPEVRSEITQFLKTKGYRLFKSIAEDRIYLHSSVSINEET
ncbi:Protein Star [Orchesella cincta]|uniref:Protein Star n=1 Tax=Orchesella cincta TaxID=48709 RepID=A0A1D2MNF2_ORCCI|nr:Protein Star [Orchesella cincta]